jgi:Kae1-associated kinase Bud32
VLLKRGAEAELTRVEWHGRQAVEKVRVAKAYRHERLDDDIRRQRIRVEARLMHEARMVGISVPILYDVDLNAHRLVMEFVDGPTVKEVLQKQLEDPRMIARAVGGLAGTLHANGLVHGDLTTSNMLWRDGRIHLIDMSMGEKTRALEAQGVDLRLLKEAWTSAHYELADLFHEVLGAYRASHPRAEASIAKMHEVEERGRYT